MQMRVTVVAAVAVATLLAAGQDSYAQTRAAARSAEERSADLTGRGTDARRVQLDLFAAKWGGYVQQVYKIDPNVWAARMAGEFMAADPYNVADAISRTSFDGALAALAGRGYKASDTRPARSLPTGGPPADTLLLPRLGSVGSDLVYTPITPCRIVDTRSTAPGAIPANSERSFLAAGEPNYTAQGGSATDCGLSGQVPAAVALNVTVVSPAAAGFATVYTFGTTRPLAASVNFSSGAVVNNAIIAQTPDPQQSSDFVIYTLAAAHYVVDIVGYFDTPAVSPLECVTTTTQSTAIAVNTAGTATAPACPTDYTAVSLVCQPEVIDTMVITMMAETSCAARNNGVATKNLFASQRCCRVPGR